MSNAVCGKTMENVRDRTCKQQKRLLKMDVKANPYVKKTI